MFLKLSLAFKNKINISFIGKKAKFTKIILFYLQGFYGK